MCFIVSLCQLDAVHAGLELLLWVQLAERGFAVIVRPARLHPHCATRGLENVPAIDIIRKQLAALWVSMSALVQVPSKSGLVKHSKCNAELTFFGKD